MQIKEFESFYSRETHCETNQSTINLKFVDPDRIELETQTAFRAQKKHFSSWSFWLSRSFVSKKTRN